MFAVFCSGKHRALSHEVINFKALNVKNYRYLLTREPCNTAYISGLGQMSMSFVNLLNVLLKL